MRRALQSNTCLETLDLDSFLNDPSLLQELLSGTTSSNFVLKHIKVLGLGCNRLQTTHAHVIGTSLRLMHQATSLSSNNCLQKLSLYNNQIGDDGAAALALGLKFQPNLQELRLARNRIGDAGCQAIVYGLRNCVSNTPSKLKELSLYDKLIGNDGAKALATLLSDGATPSPTAASATAVGRSRINRRKKPRRENEAIAAKGRCLPFLEKLSLFNNSIGDSGARAISLSLVHNTSLHTLYLDNNSIRDDGCRALAEHAIARNTSLKRLDIQRNEISEAGGSSLESALKKNINLVELACRWNDGLSVRQRRSIDRLCHDNRNYKKLLVAMKDASGLARSSSRLNSATAENLDIPSPPMPPTLWPHALQIIRDRPDMIYECVKIKPELFLYAASTSLAIASTR